MTVNGMAAAKKPASPLYLGFDFSTQQVRWIVGFEHVFKSFLLFKIISTEHAHMVCFCVFYPLYTAEGCLY